MISNLSNHHSFHIIKHEPEFQDNCQELLKVNYSKKGWHRDEMFNLALIMDPQLLLMERSTGPGVPPSGI